MGMLHGITEPEFQEGADLTILNTYYKRATFEDGKKVMDDFLVMVFRDNVTGLKHHRIKFKPTYIFYKLNDDEPTVNYNRLFIERDKVHPIEVPFSDLEYELAKETDNVDFFKANIRSGNRMENRKLHSDPNIFFSDSDIEDHYRFRFAQTYQNNIPKIKKGFYDIEVDGIGAEEDFVKMGECPINCVSFMDEATDNVYTFILRNKNNPLIEKFERKVLSGELGQKQIREFVIESVGGLRKAKKFNLLNTKYNLLFYDYEIDLLRELFAIIHKCSPDFAEGWNSSGFDNPYIIERIKALGYDPADIMCDQTWDLKVVANFIDERHKNELAERGDYTFISGNTVFIDQMIQYASRRKSKIGSYKSTKLDDIGELEAGVNKLDYSHITTSVVELPYLDFETFVLYNIMDVIVQKCIENKTNDLEYIFAKCVVNNTTYKKGHRQTVYLINRMAADWFKKGYIIGNNINKWNGNAPKYQGALVHDPAKTSPKYRMHIDGRPIWIVDNLIDFD